MVYSHWSIKLPIHPTPSQCNIVKVSKRKTVLQNAESPRHQQLRRRTPYYSHQARRVLVTASCPHLGNAKGLREQKTLSCALHAAQKLQGSSSHAAAGLLEISGDLRWEQTWRKMNNDDFFLGKCWFSCSGSNAEFGCVSSWFWLDVNKTDDLNIGMGSKPWHRMFIPPSNMVE